MALTTAQLLLLKNDILADPTLNAFPMDSDGAFAIADLYAVQAAPDFTVWKTNVPTSECKKAMVWTEFIGRSVGERDAWTFMLSNGFINPSDSNVRQGILDIFSGGTGAASRTALTALAKRLATRSEQLFSTGTGSNASPATMAVEGRLSYQDVLTARAS
jgi:hypothetical protein